MKTSTVKFEVWYRVRMERCRDGMSALRVVTVAETENCINQGKRYLQAWKKNLAVVAEFLGVGWFCQSCLCAHQGLVLCSWVSSLTVGLDRGSHCTALLVPWLSPRCLLGPVQEAVTALRDHEDKDSGPGMPSLSFCKSKAALCPNDQPQQPLPCLWAAFSRAASGTHSFLLGSSEMLLGLLLFYSSITSW